MYRFSDTAHRGSYDRIPVVAKHDKGVFLPDGVTEVEPDICLGCRAARIVGAEINPVVLLKAMKNRSDRIRFVYASDRILKR